MSGSSPKLVCESLWKLFGADVKALLAKREAPTGEEIAAAGLIGAVCDVNISILAGEIFVIMGLSGSGKSTLVRCLSRLIEPTAGHIFFEGQDLLAAGHREMIEIRRHKMGMVFQHFALLPHLTVLGNVAFPLEIQGVPRTEREGRVRQVIELVGLKGREAYFPRELSGGQQQRVGIARSLAVEPELWFLDEPFSALDPLIRREMQDEFLRLQKLLKKTIVFITHDFDEATRLADRIAIMKDGRVEQVGTPEQLCVSPQTDYVAKFTQHVSRPKVLSIRSVMTPCAAEDGGFVGDISPDLKLTEAFVLLPEDNRPLAVRDGEGVLLGKVSRQDVTSVLVQG